MDTKNIVILESAGIVIAIILFYYQNILLEANRIAIAGYTYPSTSTEYSPLPPSYRTMSTPPLTNGIGPEVQAALQFRREVAHHEDADRLRPDPLEPRPNSAPPRLEFNEDFPENGTFDDLDTLFYLQALPARFIPYVITAADFHTEWGWSTAYGILTQTQAQQNPQPLPTVTEDSTLPDLSSGSSSSEATADGPPTPLPPGSNLQAPPPPGPSPPPSPPPGPGSQASSSSGSSSSASSSYEPGPSASPPPRPSSARVAFPRPGGRVGTTVESPSPPPSGMFTAPPNDAASSLAALLGNDTPNGLFSEQIDEDLPRVRENAYRLDGTRDQDDGESIRADSPLPHNNAGQTQSSQGGNENADNGGQTTKKSWRARIKKLCFCCFTTA